MDLLSQAIDQSAVMQDIRYLLEENRKTTAHVLKQLADAKTDNWLSPQDAAEYTGFNQAWIKARSAKIGCFKDGKGLRFKKSNIDRYMTANSFGPK